MLDDIIAAIATPPGEGGIGIIRLSGQGSVDLALKFFKAASGTFVDHAPRTLVLGAWRDPESGAVLDEVMLVRFEAPRSLTGQQVVEVHAHGGHFHVQSLLKLLLRAGARLAGPGEFTQRAFLNGRVDLTRAEAVADLIASRAALSRDAAARQLRGGLFEKIEAWRREVVSLSAQAEAACDFPDDEEQLLPRQALAKKVESLLAAMRCLLATARTGKVLRQGLRVVICGRPNVGKSSLLNALVGSPRAIVNEASGTTRDYLEEGFQIEGLPVVLVDTAGIREAGDDTERQGVERSRQQLAQADLALLVLDSSAPLTTGDGMLPKELPPARLLLANKCDLKPEWGASQLKERLGEKCLGVSAKTGQGLGELKQAILDMALGSGAGEMARRLSDACLTQVRHEVALAKAEGCLAHAAKTLERVDFSAELFSVDLRSCLDALGEIVGATPRQEVLNEIFSKFCIGK